MSKPAAGNEQINYYYSQHCIDEHKLSTIKSQGKLD